MTRQPQSLTSELERVGESQTERGGYSQTERGGYSQTEAVSQPVSQPVSQSFHQVTLGPSFGVSNQGIHCSLCGKTNRSGVGWV